MDRLPHEHPGIPASPYRPLADGDVKQIADAAFDVLEKGGMAVYCQPGFDALEKLGAEVDRSTRIVKMSRALVEDALASNPSSITLYSRDGEFDAVLEKNRVHYGTGGTAIYVLDRETGQRRPTVVEDVIHNAQVVDALEHIHVFTINVFPSEIADRDDIDVNRFYHALANTRKHVMGGIYTLEGCKQVVEMAEMIAGSREALREKPFVSFITLIISPFKIDEHYGDMTCYLAQENLPVVVPTEPICGTTAPVTLAGGVLTHIAETMGGIAMVQAVNKGAPGICGSVGSITDLRTMNHLGGPIERAMLNAAVSQMAQHFEIPLYSTGGTTDALEVDIQAAYESAMSSLLVAMSGANYIHDIAGLMESDLTVAYEKLVMDNEILGMSQRVLRGIEVNDDTLGTEMLVAKGPGQDYIAEEHTVRYMRSEFFVPQVANRKKRAETAPEEMPMAKARAKVDDIFAHASPRLPEDMREKLLSRFSNIQQK